MTPTGVFVYRRFYPIFQFHMSKPKILDATAAVRLTADVALALLRWAELPLDLQDKSMTFMIQSNPGIAKLVRQFRFAADKAEGDLISHNMPK